MVNGSKLLKSKSGKGRNWLWIYGMNRTGNHGPLYRGPFEGYQFRLVMVPESLMQDGRVKRVNINKQVAKVNADSHITGLPKLSPDAKFCIFAAELKKEKKSFYDQGCFSPALLLIP